MYIATTDERPYHITEERVRSFGAGTGDLNKFHEKYAYGSQITGWIRHAVTQLLASHGFDLKCAQQESRFSAIPIPIGSHVRLPKTVSVDCTEADKKVNVKLQLYFKEDAEEKQPLAEATLVYLPTLPKDRADLSKLPLVKYGLTHTCAEQVASALDRKGIDLETLAFGYASPTLQQHGNRIIGVGEVPIFLRQTIDFYDLERPLQTGEDVYVGITNARRMKGFGSEQPREVKGVGIVNVVTTRGNENDGEIISKARFIIGIIDSQGKTIDQLIASAGTPASTPNP